MVWASSAGCSIPAAARRRSSASTTSRRSRRSLVVGLAALHGRHRLGRLPLFAGIVGALGIMLGAALASLLGLYLAAAALVAIAAVRGSLRCAPVAVTVGRRASR